MDSNSTGVRWLPLESNPEVMTKYIKNLGINDEWSFHDVYGVDPDMLTMVPKPVAAVLLLYPITEKSESSPLGASESNNNLYFIKQTVGNACGTIGIIHALANNDAQIPCDENKPLGKFFKATKGMTPLERAAALESDDNIGAAHETSAKEGQTEAPDINDHTNLHFVAFIHSDGGLYEMDGRKDEPIRHGDTTRETLLEDAAKVVKQFMERDPEEVNFSLTALALNS